MKYLAWEILALVIYNLLVMLVYGVDKWKAKAGAWRISEKVLLLLAFLLGGVGACMGMILFNHKTAKWRFRIFVPIALLTNIGVYAFFFLDSVSAL